MLDYIREKSGSLILISIIIGLGLQSSIAQTPLTEFQPKIASCLAFNDDFTPKYDDKPLTVVFITRLVPHDDFLGQACNPEKGQPDSCKEVVQIIRLVQPRLFLNSVTNFTYTYEGGESPSDHCFIE